MINDPSQVWNPYTPWSPYGGPISPFAQYFMGGNQGNLLAPYSQQAQYAFSPFSQQSAGMDPLWALFSQLFPMGNALTGYNFGGQPAQAPPVTTAQGPAQDAFPTGTPVYQPPLGASTGPGAPGAAPGGIGATPMGTALTGSPGQNMGGGPARPSGMPQTGVRTDAPMTGTASIGGMFSGTGGPQSMGFGGFSSGVGDLLGGADRGMGGLDLGGGGRGVDAEGNLRDPSHGRGMDY